MLLKSPLQDPLESIGTTCRPQLSTQQYNRQLRFQQSVVLSVMEIKNK